MRFALPISICVFAVLLFAAAYAYAATQEKFAVYYSDQASTDDFTPYQLVVLDAKHHPPIQPLLEHGKTVLGYISLGEVKNSDFYYNDLKDKGLTMAENPNWPGSYNIDIRNPYWTKLVVEDIIPSLLRDGFSGVFFDTLDSPLYLETSTPQKFKGMEDAAVRLLQAVRMHYPDMPIMVNRGYTALPRIASLIDMELGESVYADYNFSTKKYGKVSTEDYKLQVQWLNEAKQKNPKLKVYTLDYADPDDSSTISAIYKTERENGFIPYVATVGLDRLVPEPKH
jgi:polysaccharide biosynthesis protein PelA